MSLANIELKTQVTASETEIIEMADFRRLVNKNFATSEDSVSQTREVYQDLQDPSLNCL